jgi:hypothetical protein
MNYVLVLNDNNVPLCILICMQIINTKNNRQVKQCKGYCMRVFYLGDLNAGQINDIKFTVKKVKLSHATFVCHNLLKKKKKKKKKTY